MLDVAGLGVTFPVRGGAFRAVDDVGLQVAGGEVVGVVGESGSGKSMTLRGIMRLPPRGATLSGAVAWQGRDLMALPERAMRAVRGREIAMIMQNPMSALNPVLTIGAQIAEALPDGAPRGRAAELLDLVGIGAARERLANYPFEFSGGMKQRAMIAVALAGQPRLLLADEPTTALDVTIQDQILQLLLRLSDELGMAILLVTHDLGVVAETCQRVCVMYAGRIVEQGPVAAVFERPRHGYTFALRGAIPHGRPRAPLTAIPGQPPRDRGPGCAFAPRCAFVAAHCRTAAPPMAEAAPGHHAACWEAERIG